MRFYTENDVIPDRTPRDEPEALPVPNRDPRVPTTSINVALLSSIEDEEEPSTIPSSQDASENNVTEFIRFDEYYMQENDVRQSPLVNRDDVAESVDITMDSDIES